MLNFQTTFNFRPLTTWLLSKKQHAYLSSQKNTRSTVKCWDHCDKIKTVKSNVPSIKYPYFAKVFKFFIVKLKLLKKSSAEWLFASGCD